MTTNNITRRVERLERQEPPSDVLDFIYIVGIEPIVEDLGVIDGVPRHRVSASTEPPTSFFAYCLHRDCEASQHTPNDGETLAQFKARMDREHEGAAA